jgi:hypothetical protein
LIIENSNLNFEFLIVGEILRNMRVSMSTAPTTTCTKRQSIFCNAAIFIFALCYVATIPHAQAKPLPRNSRYIPSLSHNLNLFFSSGRGGSITPVETEQIQGSNSTLETTDTSPCSNNTTAFQYHSLEAVTLDENNVDASTPDKKKLKVLFLSADTGGGHRASAESLANQVGSQ